MKVVFERTQADFIEFNSFHIAHSPTIRKQLLLTRIALAVAALVLISLLGQLNENHSTSGDYILGGIIGLVLFFGYPEIYRLSVVNNAKKMWNEGNNTSLLGRHEMFLSPDGIFYKTRAGDSNMSWASIDKMLQNDKYIFIYIGAINALVVPKDAFASDRERKDFLAYVRSHIRQ